MLAWANRLPWANVVMLALGAVLAFLAAPIIVLSVGMLRAWYDEAYPPSKMDVYWSEYLDPSTISMRFTVTRLRDCEFIRMTGFSGPSYESMQPATSLHRQDGYAPISYPIGIKVISPPWLMSPIYGPRIVLYGYYDCDERIVKSRVIDAEVAP